MADEAAVVVVGRSGLSPPPRPKSPPMYPDLYGKRRETARLQMLDREIILLQEDLKFVEGLQPASSYCKEVVDFVVAAADPLTPRNTKDHKSCRAWRWLSNLPCFNIQWLCCCRHCSFSFQLPKCCRSCISRNCTLPKCDNSCSSCYQKSSCSTNCCNFTCPTLSSSSSSSCFHSICTDWSCHMPKCAPWSYCYHCKCINKNKCCNPCYSCCCCCTERVVGHNPHVKKPRDLTILEYLLMRSTAGRQPAIKSGAVNLSIYHSQLERKNNQAHSAPLNQ